LLVPDLSRWACHTFLTLMPAHPLKMLNPIADGDCMEQDQPHRCPMSWKDKSVFVADYISELVPSRTISME